MLPYRIELTESAKADLACYRPFEQRLIVPQIKEQLQHEPSRESANRKMLRDNPLAPWELRVGRYRAFYRVLEDEPVVLVAAIGHKEHNALFIRGEEVQL
jgi:mRNA-degrading endonuclease RelE of RelBE toxin-antitoxin system